MHDFTEFLRQLIDPVWIHEHGGLYLVALIIFAETGLFVGFFLPGDSLLFVTGMLIAQHQAPFLSDPANLFYWIILISVCGIIGNFVGYWFGRKSGPLLFERRDTLLFKRRHIEQAKEFYEKKGGTAIILARFLPIVRTFAPIVAGVVAMDRKKFLFYNVVGSIAWVGSMILAGYLLGEVAWVKNNLEKIIIALILVTTAPVLLKMIFGGKKKKETTV
ncbi:VTT domain-containing protein [Danxiaibacter flavus]|uniref:VTT domain-containing protein n=1 Tax=Danxiaibacter flavus TaxID=3049108 RepID=A0ABV3Z926_9BACT|nr:VTT domain-containing protein [Chitinophagaceae bacterium DXS]